MTLALLGLATLAAQAAPPKPLIATDVQCSGCVNQQDIAANAVGAAQIQQDAVGSSEIAAGSVGEQELTQSLLDRIATLENQLATRQGAVQVLANGQSIGTFLDQDYGPHGPVFLTRSDRGYMFPVQMLSAPLGSPDYEQPGQLSPYDIEFESAGCIGDAYVLVTYQGDLGRNNQGPLLAEQGVVFDAGDGRRYIPKGALAVDRHFQSERSWSSGTCYSWTPPAGPGGNSVPTLPNDPTVTGVPNDRFAEPITLGY
jgi:hypothetical protein